MPDNGDAKRIVIDQLHSVNYVAELLGVHRNTVYGLIAEGKLEAFRIRSSLKVSRGSVMEYLDIQRVKVGEDS
jgi:excisionase family DNA binding protein